MAAERRDSESGKYPMKNGMKQRADSDPTKGCAGAEFLCVGTPLLCDAREGSV